VKDMLDLFRQKKQPPFTVDRSALIADAHYVVIDTELTGLSERRDSIISIGAIRMVGTRIDLGGRFHQFVKPETKFDPDSVVIHGITPSDVLEKPNIDTILCDFIDFCGDDIIVGHCVFIDMGFIDRDTRRICGSTMQNPVIDTFRIYEWLQKRVSHRPCFSSVPKEVGLHQIAKCFGIPVRGAHDALMDAFITAQLLQRFIPVIIDVGVKHIGDLLTLGHPSEGGDKSRVSSEISNF